ncbi:MAG: HAD family phosphatase [Anaerolineales bacterium]|nr:HAD family phosphatase [Anaerolineales bacterium]
MLKALIFDFDGLILDTETLEMTVWQEMYQARGFELPLAEWMKAVGGDGISNFDAAERLALLSAGRLNPDSLRAEYRQTEDQSIHAQPILPGVTALLKAAKQAGLKIAIGSSSPHTWVDAHTQRLDIFHYFDSITCRDDVSVGRTKPHPDIYLKALERLEVQKNEAVVFEDSVNGVEAARRAGIFVIAVPNPLTAQMGVSGDLTLASLAELRLSDLQERFVNSL